MHALSRIVIIGHWEISYRSFTLLLNRAEPRLPGILLHVEALLLHTHRSTETVTLSVTAGTTPRRYNLT